MPPPRCLLGENIRERTWCRTQTDARMQRRREICSHPPAARALCLSSQSAPYIMRSTCRKCGADEGQMRKLIGYLVARKGAEQAAARMAAGISQQFLCKEDRAERVRALFGDDSIGESFA